MPRSVLVKYRMMPESPDVDVNKIKEMYVFGSGVKALNHAKEILEKAENGEYKSVKEAAKDIKDLKSEIAFYLDWD